MILLETFENVAHTKQFPHRCTPIQLFFFNRSGLILNTNNKGNTEETVFSCIALDVTFDMSRKYDDQTFSF